MRAAHVIKGAAANLMCGQLRAAAYQLEHSANVAHAAGASPSAEQQQAVQAGYAALQAAAQNYLTFLKSIGIE